MSVINPQDEMQFVYDDGGRTTAGYTGRTGDCVVRAIAIATERPYQEVYDAINLIAKQERTGTRKRGKSSARNGVYKQTYRRYLESIGWRFVPTMHIGSGCKVHLVAAELPQGRLIVSLSKHLVAIIDHVIHDAGDPQRWTITTQEGVQRAAARCVYGYFVNQEAR